jgi:hypothetical protein
MRALKNILWGWVIFLIFAVGTHLIYPAKITQGYSIEIPLHHTLSMPAQEALQKTVSSWQGNAPYENTFYVTSVMWHETWAIVYVSLQSTHFHDMEDLVGVLLVQTDNGWQGEFLENALTLSHHIPSHELSDSNKQILFSPAVPNAAQQYFAYKFPWHSGQAWKLTRSAPGWHGDFPPSPIPVDHALDFDIVGENNADIISAAPGLAEITCNDSSQVMIVVTTQGTSNEKLGYLHLDPNSFDVNDYPKEVEQGEYLGRMKEVEGEFVSPCGTIQGTHLHFFLPTKPFVMDGETFDSVSVPAGKELYSSQDVSDPSSGSDYPFPPNGHFPDVGANHAFFNYIETLYYIGAVNGYSDGTFRPDENITRGAVSKMIILAMGEEYREDEELPEPFSDVPPSHTFYPHIMRMKDLGITSGFSDGTFRPDIPLTRGALAKFIVIAHDGEEPSYNDCVQIFPDVACDYTFYSHIRRLKEIFDNANESLGYSDGTFRPDDNISRGGASKLIVVGLDWKPMFSDVQYFHGFFPYIQGIGKRGIASGFSDNTFRPETELTRGALAKFIVRGLGHTPQASDYPIPTFSDVTASHAFYAEIEFLARANVIHGFSDGTFRPDIAVTRGATAKMVVNALANIWDIQCQYTQPPQFSDVPTTYIFYREIQCLKELEITSGFSDGTFRPDNNITRGEAAKFIYIGFVQLAPNVPQEALNTANNQQTTAPFYTNGERFVLSKGDTDWVKFDATARRGGSSLTGYWITSVNPGINLNIELCLFDGNTMITCQSTNPITGKTNLLWIPTASGTYHVRMVNTNSNTSEGIFTNLVIKEVALTNNAYLPVLRR